MPANDIKSVVVHSFRLRHVALYFIGEVYYLFEIRVKQNNELKHVGTTTKSRYHQYDIYTYLS